ncbi:helix-turn-helix domain-containing protein [Niabella ginsengisoli]|uniref:Helix-turn-helix domain-containing protein n=1 Tax=Niabella ginsengisoli TaxID=522298 RepID=A0ABS9SIV1_9BACT|nr:helix-turn-helix transcriptional regulator [Niabella ginsengisoli]MCH5598284.1 helix-turn-helix domain-containing protein [Niabella ginsengisoli]
MQDEVLLTISNRIKEIRQAKKITTERLAKSANVSKGLISQIENNRTVPSLPVLINILQALGVDLNDFFKDISYDKKIIKVLNLRNPKNIKPLKKNMRKEFPIIAFLRAPYLTIL